MTRDMFLLSIGAISGVGAFVAGWICAEIVMRWRERRKPPPF